MSKYKSFNKSTGEVSAIYGYKKQYEICAVEIYDALRDNQLVGVEFASSELSKLDDCYQKAKVQKKWQFAIHKNW